jgi:DNA-binding transcriptional LysR family regulator
VRCVRRAASPQRSRRAASRTIRSTIAWAAVVPSLALQPGAYPNLRVLALIAPPVTRGFALLQRRGGSLSPAAQAMVDLIVRDAARRLR